MTGPGFARKRFSCLESRVPAPPAGLRFELGAKGEAVNGFLVRTPGGIRAYRNRCAHMALELDLNPGVFFSRDNQYLICSTHGALFDPVDGGCLAGPCVGGRLERLPVRQEDALVIVEAP